MKEDQKTLKFLLIQYPSISQPLKNQAEVLKKPIPVIEKPQIGGFDNRFPSGGIKEPLVFIKPTIEKQQIQVSGDNRIPSQSIKDPLIHTKPDQLSQRQLDNEIPVSEISESEDEQPAKKRRVDLDIAEKLTKSAVIAGFWFFCYYNNQAIYKFI